jgi:carboxymethylenebutenolidase
MLRSLFVCAVVASATLAHAAPPFVVTSDPIEYASGSEKISGLLFRSTKKTEKAPTKHPAMVLIHEWWGLNPWAKEKAQALAADGYVTLAVDLYRGRSTDKRDEAHELSRGLPHDRALRDLHAAIDALAKRPDVDPNRIGVIGWCMGGGYAVELAGSDPRIKATVVYYGALPTDVKSLKAPLLGNFGADDKGIPAGDVRTFAAALNAQGTPADVKIYPGAGHAFASGDAASHAEAAKDADERTKKFLEKTLHP